MFKSQNYTYRNCEQILEAVKPLLNGLSLILTDEVVSIGTRIYVKATARLSDGVVAVDASAYAHEEQQQFIKGGQLTGASSSYARKYALCGLFAIDSGKDLDALPTPRKQKTVADKSPIPALVSQIQKIKDLGSDMAAVLKYYKTDALTYDQATQVIELLERKNNVVKKTL